MKTLKAILETLRDILFQLRCANKRLERIAQSLEDQSHDSPD